MDEYRLHEMTYMEIGALIRELSKRAKTAERKFLDAGRVAKEMAAPLAEMIIEEDEDSWVNDMPKDVLRTVYESWDIYSAWMRSLSFEEEQAIISEEDDADDL